MQRRLSWWVTAATWTQWCDAPSSSLVILIIILIIKELNGQNEHSSDTEYWKWLDFECVTHQLCVFRCLCIRSVCNGHFRQRRSARYRKSGSSFPVCLPAQLHCPWLPGCKTVCQPIRCLHWWPWWHHESQKNVPFQRGSTEPLHCNLPGCESLTNTILSCLFKRSDRKWLSFQMYVMSCVGFRAGRLTGPVLSLSLVSLAMLTGINRVAEYRNHWVDVIAGQVIGGAVAVFLVRDIRLVILGQRCQMDLLWRGQRGENDYL